MIPNSQLPQNKQLRITPLAAVHPHAQEPTDTKGRPKGGATDAPKNSHSGRQKIQFLDAFRAGVGRFKAERLTTTEVAVILTDQLGFPVTMSQVREMRDNLGESWTPRGTTKPSAGNAKLAKYRDGIPVIAREVARMAEALGFETSEEFKRVLTALTEPAVG